MRCRCVQVDRKATGLLLRTCVKQCDSAAAIMLTFGCGASSKGAATAPFGMMVHNEPDRFHLAIKAIERMPGLKERHPT